MRTGKLANPYLSIMPRGRLTYASGDATPTADQTSKTTLYYTPYNGATVHLWNGSLWVPYALNEVSLSLSGLSAGNYDIFLYDNSGTLTMQAVAWTNGTTRASAISLADGLWLKTSDSRLLLGSIRLVSTGTGESSVSKRFISNAYNQIFGNLKRADTTSSWTYAFGTTWRQARAAAANQVDWINCLPGTRVSLTYSSYCQSLSTNQCWVGIGLDSTSTPSSDCAICIGANNLGASLVAQAEFLPAIGYHYASMLELVTGSAGNGTFYGTSLGFEINKIVGGVMY